MHKDKVDVPNYEYIRKMVLKEMHDNYFARNFGYKNTVAIVRKQ